MLTVIIIAYRNTPYSNRMIKNLLHDFPYFVTIITKSRYKEENGTIMLMLVFLMAISAVVITVFFYVLTLLKSNQFGIMKAIGASNQFLGRAVVAQVFMLSVVSIGAGILLTYGTAAIFPDGISFALDPMLISSMPWF